MAAFFLPEHNPGGHGATRTSPLFIFLFFGLFGIFTGPVSLREPLIRK
jgi:hypothetical protein